MSIFDEKEWDKQCSSAVSFKSMKDQGKCQKPKKLVKAKNRVAKIKKGKIQKIKAVPPKKEKLKNIKHNAHLQKELVEGNTSKKGKDLDTFSENISKFKDKLKDTLSSSRFRFINEQLYTTTGSSAKELFENDSEAFEAYHTGYRNQVQKWPENPLDRIIKTVKKMPINYVIADFGCGEGRLSQSVPHKVYSIDLVGSRDDIIACDMANTPLKTGSIDVVVFCLSLMGVNVSDFILEANRVLREGGMIHIAEITSRFDNLNQFIRIMKSNGFELVKKDVSHKLFYFFSFKKSKNVSKNSVVQFSLKPCLYKKR